MKNPLRNLRKTHGTCIDCGGPRGDSPTVRCDGCRSTHNAENRIRDRRSRIGTTRAHTLAIADRLEALSRRLMAGHMAPELVRIASELRALAGTERAA